MQLIFKYLLISNSKTPWLEDQTIKSHLSMQDNKYRSWKPSWSERIRTHDPYVSNSSDNARTQIKEDSEFILTEVFKILYNCASIVTSLSPYENNLIVLSMFVNTSDILHSLRYI